MNKEEIKIITLGDIFDNLETEEQAFKFLKYIKNQQQELERLNNIINELEKYLKDKEQYYWTIDCQKEVKYEFLRISNEYTKILNKLKELKGE